MSWTLIRTILASNVSIKKKTGGVQSPNVLGRAFPKSREGRELWKDWDREQGDREVKQTSPSYTSIKEYITHRSS